MFNGVNQNYSLGTYFTTFRAPFSERTCFFAVKDVCRANMKVSKKTTFLQSPCASQQRKTNVGYTILHSLEAFFLEYFFPVFSGSLLTLGRLEK